MPYTISEKHGRDWVLQYTNSQGQPGKIDPSYETVITLLPDGGATVVAQPFDPATGQQVIKIDHNGTVTPDLAVTIENDGDLGSGTNKISITEHFEMKAPEGASGVTTVGVGEERPSA